MTTPVLDGKAFHLLRSSLNATAAMREQSSALNADEQVAGLKKAVMRRNAQRESVTIIRAAREEAAAEQQPALKAGTSSHGRFHVDLSSAVLRRAESALQLQLSPIPSPHTTTSTNKPDAEQSPGAGRDAPSGHSMLCGGPAPPPLGQRLSVLGSSTPPSQWVLPSPPPPQGAAGTRLSLGVGRSSSSRGLSVLLPAGSGAADVATPSALQTSSGATPGTLPLPIGTPRRSMPSHASSSGSILLSPTFGPSGPRRVSNGGGGGGGGGGGEPVRVNAGLSLSGRAGSLPAPLLTTSPTGGKTWPAVVGAAAVAVPPGALPACSVQPPVASISARALISSATSLTPHGRPTPPSSLAATESTGPGSARPSSLAALSPTGAPSRRGLRQRANSSPGTLSLLLADGPTTPTPAAGGLLSNAAAAALPSPKKDACFSSKTVLGALFADAVALSGAIAAAAPAPGLPSRSLRQRAVSQPLPPPVHASPSTSGSFAMTSGSVTSGSVLCHVDEEIEG